jgi:hypothetical protein
MGEMADSVPSLAEFQRSDWVSKYGNASLRDRLARPKKYITLINESNHRSCHELTIVSF